MSTSFGSLFNASYYAARNPDLVAAGLTTSAQLTSHFLNYGLNEGRTFSPYVDLKFYSSSNPGLAAAGLTTNQQLFNHLETYGVDGGRKFSPFVDLNFYQANNPELAQAGFTTNSQLLQHLETYGVDEGRKFSPFVDLNFYKANNPDLAKAGFTTNSQLLQHLETYGVDEGRKFSPFVDLGFYKADNPELAQAGFTTNSQLLQHLEIYGVNEGQKFSPFVDLNFYNSNNPDLAKAGFTTDSQLLRHLLETYGVDEGRKFSPFVDLSFYKANNSNLAQAGLTTNSQLLQHLENYGVNEGRKFSPFVDLSFYKANNPDLAKAGLVTNSQLLNHFEIYGLQEGRQSYPGKTTYKAENGEILSAFDPTPSTDLVYRGGKTIAHLNYYNLYLGGYQSWSSSDIQNIDFSLSQAMSDPRLNSIMSQYFAGQQITSNFLGSRVVDASIPDQVSQQFIETVIAGVGKQGGFNGFDLSSTVVDFMLPENTILTQGDSHSLAGLAGYHGSVDFLAPDGTQKSAYYAIGVYSEDYPYLGVTNGITNFNQPWKNVVATAYHELNEARTDPDVEESNRTGNNTLLGWYSDAGGEVGDYPITEAYQSGSNSAVFTEVPLVKGKGTVPIQVLYSNAVHGPEDPTAILLG